MKDEAKCPVMHNNARATTGSFANQHWWPNLLNLKVLHQNPLAGDPNGEDFDYAEAFNSIDYSALKEDLAALMTDSQEWWPADWGNYAGLMVRMAWHSAGTYRVQDGRGGAGSGTQRFAPLNSWPDNINLDKARRLLWPIKQKYGRKLSWADLMILAGNVGMENAGFKSFGFAGGREDVWEPEEDIYWGPETEWLGDERYTGDRELDHPLGAVQMGLIYVNPEGPNGEPDPVKSGRDIRETFARMAMNDYETVALVAGGHTFGKCHGAGVPDDYVSREPEGAALEEQGLGWDCTLEDGVGANTISSGIEGAWTKNPAKWDHNYFENLFEYEWELTKSPAGAYQWVAVDAEGTVPPVRPGAEASAPIMTTADMALRMDPVYEPISRNFYENPEEFADAYAKAWFKLTHRDMGPVSRYLGPEVPHEVFAWQDPLPEVDHDLVSGEDIASLKQTILDSDLSISQLVNTAWASASTYRDSDKRGGANGARIRLEPMNSWRANAGTGEVISALEKIQQDFNSSQSGNTKISLADTIVLGGCAAVEAAARTAGFPVSVPFAPGRTDASQDQTEVDSFAYLEPRADGFRNYDNGDNPQRQEELLVDKAQLLSLTAPEMTVLVGGLRALAANTGGSDLGVFTDRPGELTNDFFVNLLDMGTKWERTDDPTVFVGKDRESGETKWKGSRVDLVFGSNSQLRALAEVYACADARDKFVHDFVYAWDKVMNLDRFDLD